MPDGCIHQGCNLIYMYLMNIIVPGMLYYGPVVRQVLSWADVQRPPAPCGSGCHRDWYQSSQPGIDFLALDHHYHQPVMTIRDLTHPWHPAWPLLINRWRSRDGHVLTPLSPPSYPWNE